MLLTGFNTGWSISALWPWIALLKRYHAAWKIDLLVNNERIHAWLKVLDEPYFYDQVYTHADHLPMHYDLVIHGHDDPDILQHPRIRCIPNRRGWIKTWRGFWLFNQRVFKRLQYAHPVNQLAPLFRCFQLADRLDFMDMNPYPRQVNDPCMPIDILYDVTTSSAWPYHQLLGRHLQQLGYHVRWNPSWQVMKERPGLIVTWSDEAALAAFLGLAVLFLHDQSDYHQAWPLGEQVSCYQTMKRACCSLRQVIHQVESVWAQYQSQAHPLMMPESTCDARRF